MDYGDRGRNSGRVVDHRRVRNAEVPARQRPVTLIRPGRRGAGPDAGAATRWAARHGTRTGTSWRAEVYEFHRWWPSCKFTARGGLVLPRCAEDRLYTSAPGSLAVAAPQTALWQSRSPYTLAGWRLSGLHGRGLGGLGTADKTHATRKSIFGHLPARMCRTPSCWPEAHSRTADAVNRTLRPCALKARWDHLKAHVA
jgi:hypothetical protein